VKALEIFTKRREKSKGDFANTVPIPVSSFGRGRPQIHTHTKIIITNQTKMESYDIVIIGAGISGIGAAYHLLHELPDKKFLILETKDHFGGTWHTHEYPGVRSDSDLHTFGYSFKPWTGVPIATGAEIMKYLSDVIDENNISPHIRYSHRVLSCSYSSQDQHWTVDVSKGDNNELVSFKTSFLWTCQGYYDHEKPYIPQWPGIADYQGTLIHPQKWPKELDLTDKKVVVIGSGATAATIIPAIAEKAAHVTQLQRSPTYYFSPPRNNELATELRKLKINEEWIHEIMRRKNLAQSLEFMNVAAAYPEMAKKILLDSARAVLGPENEELIEKHFTPSYRPWQQRIALLPDGDLLKTVKSGKASMVTDEISTFTKDGIVTKKGETLTADVIITATGFNLSFIGDIPFFVDGKRIYWNETITYRGFMFTGLPNFVTIFGYLRSSWTLRVDMVSNFVCRLLKHMKEKQLTEVSVKVRDEAEDKDMKVMSWMDFENFNSGYFQRSVHLWPKRGDKVEWQHSQDYYKDVVEFPTIEMDSNVFNYK
jgi:cation diffusion facilitator CzcD-associated flavoprotein CzcO